MAKMTKIRRPNQNQSPAPTVMKYSVHRPYLRAILINCIGKSPLNALTVTQSLKERVIGNITKEYFILRIQRITPVHFVVIAQTRNTTLLCMRKVFILKRKIHMLPESSESETEETNKDTMLRQHSQGNYISMNLNHVLGGNCCNSFFVILTINIDIITPL